MEYTVKALENVSLSVIKSGQCIVMQICCNVWLNSLAPVSHEYHYPAHKNKQTNRQTKTTPINRQNAIQVRRKALPANKQPPDI